MSSEAASRVDVVALGACSAATMTWRMRGELRVTVLVKGTFALQPDAPMRLIAPEEIVTSEVHHGKNPSRSVRLTTDLVPYLPAADVVLTGHACAPQDETALGMSVRLAVYRENALLDKSINVLCSTEDGCDVPFETMPLVYEKAYGGVGFSDNPFGVGVGSPPGRTPNLADPREETRVACFAPIARGWPNRRRLLGKVDRKTLDAAVCEIPEGFNFAYFQAAPPDQQIAYLQGNEWVVLEGMHRVHTQICSCLPSAIGRARVYGIGGAGQGRALALVADMLRIDADSLTCSVTWRGSFAVGDAAALSRLTIHAGVETADMGVDWPPPPEAPAARPAAPEPVVENTSSLEGTVVSVSAPSPGLTAPPSTPVSGRAGQVDGSKTAPSPVGPAPAVRARKSWDSTVEIGDHEPSRPSSAIPFRQGPVNLPPPSEPQKREPDFSATIATAELVDEPEKGPPTLPFQGHHGAAVVARAAARQAGGATRAPADPAGPLDLSTPPLPAAPDAAEPPRPEGPKRPRTPEGIEIVNETPLALRTVRWDMLPSRCAITVIAKATCDLVPDGPAAVRPSAAEPSGEIREPGPRGPNTVYPSDLVPFKVRADVALVGHAHAPPGGAAEMEVRFKLGEDGRGFDRKLLVFGDRTWVRSGAFYRPSAPERFLQIPLSLDRAFGGKGYEKNPVGLGFFSGNPKNPVPMPNLEDPRSRVRTPKQAPEPACFAPLPAGSREPRGGADPAARSLPERFDWTRHQAAPPEQRLGFLRGDEPFEIAGVHPKLPVLKGTLPGLAVRCFAERPRGREEVPMRLDTAFFDLDDKTLTLVWRGVLPVSDERTPDVRSLRLVTAPIGEDDVSATA